MRRAVRRYLAAVLMPMMVCNACFAYRPVVNPTPRVGAEVRATFSEPQTFQLGEFTVHDVRSLEGQVRSAQGDTVLVWATWLNTRIGSRYSGQGGSFALPRAQVATLEERRLSAGRSGLAALMTAGLVVALFSLVQAALGGSGNSGEQPNPI